MKRNKILWIVILLIGIVGFSKGVSADAASLALKYDGKTYRYTGSQVGVRVDETSVNIGTTKGIIINNNCFVPAKSVFSTVLKGSYSYNSKTGKIVIKKDNVSIEMVLGSKTAYVNKKAKTMPDMPKKITFVKEKQTSIYVPGRFVTEALGYTYQWNQTKKTADISSPFTIKYDNAWVAYKGTKGAVICDDKKVNLSGMPSIILNNTALLRANSVFKGTLGAEYSYDKKTKKVKIANETAAIIMQINSKKAIVNEKEYTMSTPARMVTNKENGKSYVMVPGEFVTTKLGYSYKWESSIKTSVISTIISKDGADSEEEDMDDEKENDDVINTDSEYQIEFSLPNGIKYDSVANEDQYYKTQFVLSVPENQEDFYNENEITMDSSIIKKCTVSYDEEEDRTNITVVTKKLQGYRIEKTKNGIGIQVASPKEIYDRIVVLDPGHGASAVGTSQNGVYEKNLNLEILYDKAKEYFNGEDSTIKAYWTRIDDTNPSLADRAKFAKKVGADVFISLHMNSAGKTASGTETLYASNNKNTENSMDSKKMASLFQDYLVDKLGLKGRKIVDRTGLYVLKYNSVPAILIELGFMSNTNDFSQLMDESFQDEAARAIYEAAELMYETYLG